MSLVANDLKTAWRNAFPEVTNPGDMLSTWATTTADYLKDNTEIVFTWTAFSGPTPDPVVIATGEIVSLSFPLTLSNTTDHSTAINHFKNELISGLSSGTYNITQLGWITSPNVFSTSPTISNLNLDFTGIEANADDVLLEFATRIITWVKDQTPTGPCAGTHGSYTGSGIVASIT